MLTFTSPFSVNEEKIIDLPSKLQMEMIELHANMMLKTKFNEEQSPIPGATAEIINFWKILPAEHFPSLRRFAQRNIAKFGSTYRCEQTFCTMKLIKSNQRSRITDSNLKSYCS